MGSSEEQKTPDINRSETVKTESTSSCTTDDGQMKYGDRLLDDLMNTFCDKLQSVSPHKLEGMMAIQFILGGAQVRRRRMRWIIRFKYKFRCKKYSVDPSQVASMITGKHRVFQIIFDSTRTHYVLLDYDPKRGKVVVYDSLLDDSNYSKLLNVPVITQISCLFGHLFPSKEVKVEIETDYAKQSEDWSCGYRAIACITDLVRGKVPGETEYSRTKIYDFLLQIISTKKVTWEQFEKVKLGSKRELTKRPRIEVVVLPNEKYRLCSLMKENDSESEKEEASAEPNSIKNQHISKTDAVELTNRLMNISVNESVPPSTCSSSERKVESTVSSQPSLSELQPSCKSSVEQPLKVATTPVSTE